MVRNALYFQLIISNFKLNFEHVALSLSVTLLKSTMPSHDKISPTGGNIVLITNSKLDISYPNKNTITEQVSLISLISIITKNLMS